MDRSTHLTMHGPRLVLHAYAPLARLALHRLVRPDVGRHPWRTRHPVADVRWRIIWSDSPALVGAGTRPCASE